MGQMEVKQPFPPNMGTLTWLLSWFEVSSSQFFSSTHSHVLRFEGWNSLDLAILRGPELHFHILKRLQPSVVL